MHLMIPFVSALSEAATQVLRDLSLPQLARALTLLSPTRRDEGDESTLLTPHDREFARFGRDVGPDRLGAARWLASELDVAVLLKGDATVVVAGGRARVGTTGSPLLATAGSGDVLSGATGALLAQGLDVLDAASVAVHLHGRAGVLSASGASTSASALLEAWPDAVREARAGTMAR